MGGGGGRRGHRAARGGSAEVGEGGGPLERGGGPRGTKIDVRVLIPLRSPSHFPFSPVPLVMHGIRVSPSLVPQRSPVAGDEAPFQLHSAFPPAATAAAAAAPFLGGPSARRGKYAGGGVRSWLRLDARGEAHVLEADK